MISHRYPYEHHHHVWSNIKYPLHTSSTTIFPRFWTVPYGHPMGNLHYLHQHWWNFFILKLCIYSLWQEKIHYIIIQQATLDQYYLSSLTTLEEHRNLFNQGHPILEPEIWHHEVFSTTTPLEHTNFVQSIKVQDQVNWIKGSYAQYDNNISFFSLPLHFRMIFSRALSVSLVISWIQPSRKIQKDLPLLPMTLFQWWLTVKGYLILPILIPGDFIPYYLSCCWDLCCLPHHHWLSHILLTPSKILSRPPPSAILSTAHPIT